jgi:hypothetical protein
LEQLERELRVAQRRSRWGLVAVGLGIVGLALAGTVAYTAATAQAQGGKVLRANEFILEDRTGKPRGGLRVTESGPGLGLTSETGKLLALLSAGKDGALLTLNDEEGTPHLIAEAKTGGGTLALRRGIGKAGVGLFAIKEGPALILFDEKGTTRGVFKAVGAGVALEMADETGRLRANTVVTQLGSQFALLDKNGNVTWSQPK